MVQTVQWFTIMHKEQTPGRSSRLPPEGRTSSVRALFLQYTLQQTPVFLYCTFVKECTVSKNLTRKLIESHLVHGKMTPGEEIGLKIDQTLMQDATGTMVMLQLEALGLGKVKTEVSVQYVDHNLLQTDYRNADDHLFLASACRRFGICYSRPGNGVSHPVHMENFGIPGKTLLGSDSHTCSGGSMGMLAVGAGGLEVAAAMAGEPFFVKMPLVRGVKLTGKLPDWVSAKDVVLELLRRHGVKGGVGRVFEYYGPGLSSLGAMDRHTIANMGAELGATTSVFPSDGVLREFLQSQGREQDWVELVPDEDALYDETEVIDLSSLIPLIALPGSPGNVVPVREVGGREIHQAYIGSSANPGFRDIAVVAQVMHGKQVHPLVSLDINPASRQVLESLTDTGYLQKLIHAGARIHQAGCNGCIGMGQAPATGKISLRTVPRNFPGRSGTVHDQIYLCSPETAAASALTGKITDPRTLDLEYTPIREPLHPRINRSIFVLPESSTTEVELQKGPNIKPLPQFEPLPDTMELPVLLKTDDNISTDDILPAGARVLPFRSNIPAISTFLFSQIDESFHNRAKECSDGFMIAGGENYGQGSSREHAALAPRYLGLRAVLALSFARIHWQNLVNFGILPLAFVNRKQVADVDQGDVLRIEGVREILGDRKSEIEIFNLTKGVSIGAEHKLSERQVQTLLAGGLINRIKHKAFSTEHG